MAPALREDASGATVAVDIAIAVVIGAEADALEGVMVVAGVGPVPQVGDMTTFDCAIVDGSTVGTSKVILPLEKLITAFLTGVDLTVDGVIAGDNVAEEEARSESFFSVDSAIVVDNVAEADALGEVMVVPGIVGTVSLNGGEVTVGCAIIDGSEVVTVKVMLLPDTLLTVFSTGVDLTVDGVIAGDNVAEEEARSESFISVDSAIVVDEAGFETSMVVDAPAPVSLPAAGVAADGTTGVVNGAEADALEEVMVVPGIVGTVSLNGGEVTVGCAIVDGSEVVTGKVILLPDTLLTVPSTGVDLTVDGVIAVDNVAEEEARSESFFSVDSAIVVDEAGFETSMVVDAPAPVSLPAVGVAADGTTGVVNGAEADALEEVMVVADIVGTVSLNGGEVTVGCAIVDGSKVVTVKVMLLPDTLLTVFSTGVDLTVDGVIAGDNVAEEEARSVSFISLDSAIVVDEAGFETSMVVDAPAPVSLPAADVAADGTTGVVNGAEADALGEVIVVADIVGTVFRNGGEVTVGCAIVDGSEVVTGKVMLLPDTLLTVPSTGVDLTVDGVIAGDNVAEEEARSVSFISVDSAIFVDEAGFETSMVVDAPAPVSLPAAGVAADGTTGVVNGAEADALEEVMVVPGIVGTVSLNGGEVTVGGAIVDGSKVETGKVMLLPDALLTVFSTGVDLTVDGVIAEGNVAEEEARSVPFISVDSVTVVENVAEEAGFETSMEVDALAPVSLPAAVVAADGATVLVNGAGQVRPGKGMSDAMGRVSTEKKSLLKLLGMPNWSRYS
ncbi:hypothetical protein [Endozoicomonas acroporae]|uniref:hypothetical protein n=1 Tax=Endozoicomonas acroporae TaxID=1701104 RepID=UPI0013CF5D33|nr:hypothetical protein [Endozoicomonas acroporae]